MGYLERLKAASTIQDLAVLLNLKASQLSYALFILPDEKKYTQFGVPKKAGGERIINAPQERLKHIQRSLADLLQHCILEIEGSKPQPNPRPLSHGFRKKTEINSNRKNTISFGIHTNAHNHQNKKYVLNFDLSEFFSSFNFGRVRGFFIKNNDFRLHPAVATLIAQIGCFKNELPQGSPCSPIITNLIAHILDIRLVRWAKKNRCSYSRYVDDITLSTNQEMSEKLATQSDGLIKWSLNKNIENIVARSGFQINPLKTRLQIQLSRQIVTGLVVNKKINVKNEYYRSARAMCHALFSTGSFFLLGDQSKFGTLQQLNGILGYIYFIKQKNHCNGGSCHKKTAIEPHNITNLYSRFLYFRYFIALEKPLIICEGKTDVAYLKMAIKQLKKESKYHLPHQIDFFHFTERISEVMHINAGTTALKKFIESYKKNIAFTKMIPRNPIIVLLDNDNEAGNVVKCLENKFKKPNVNYDRNKNFIYSVIENLYVVLLPIKKQQGKKEQSLIIENFFDPSVLKIKLGKKVFSPENGNGFDSQRHYSKQVLVEKIIRPKQDTINFSLFKAIFDLIMDVIEQYKPINK
ncbi:retron Ec67 family RNA-directed DNA polymerase/endonuclease [Legionella maioricensis]|uniref:RNA-directed DNA polymerase n=1 Tax=Legionella maioricensis TaxID=2896528 RepID=A0A9X2D3A9_9GAMM|nr:retron Ec67 family RNA-directed DNA polymerase/endonuclease [Legionella maioricensis]MCL9685749.1 retron Ec67 family RNA-directed DNA polymerase/endonuclease [Legionella maioricensis]MCL9686449.1 retron Ec67 family RNA-directed DNA polymerase/endonuclease [Legionella maioricensis]